LIEDALVKLDKVSGAAAKGKVHTSGTLDFRGAVTSLAFAIKADQLWLKQLPAKWELPEKLSGTISGQAYIVGKWAASEGCLSIIAGERRWRGPPGGQRHGRGGPGTEAAARRGGRGCEREDGDRAEARGAGGNVAGRRVCRQRARPSEPGAEPVRGAAPDRASRRRR
ncbi:hypothetical protein B4Q13_25600, partial [Lacticaseibacillus rhamnosus]